MAVTRHGRVWAHQARPLPVRCPGARRRPWGTEDGPEPAPLTGQWLAPSPLVSEHDGAGTVYLLHFDAPFGHARHYLGWASPGHLGLRLSHHEAGTGANLLRHVSKAGIGWTLARTWPGDRHRERQLKSRGHTRRCPLCCPDLGPRLAKATVPRPPVSGVHNGGVTHPHAEETPMWPFTEDEPCDDCGGDHATDEHDSLAALDEDADRWTER